MATGKGKLPKGVQNQTPVKTMATRSKQAKKQHFSLELLPAVVLDKILGLLQPQDLRSFHQVSRAWKSALSSRLYIDSRRIDLVNKIRRNKENIANSCSLDSSITPSAKQTSEPRNHDGKPGSRSILSSRIRNSDNFGPPNASRTLSRSASTPKSRFEQVYNAGKKLLKGQVLFSCPECRSPVPSPVTSTHSQSIQQFSDNTPKKSSTTSNLNLTHDSGFESIEVSADQDSSINHSAAGDTSIEEISLSFIATPETGSCIPQRDVTPIQALTIDGDSSSSSRRRNNEIESAECPSCNHRFCCKCQCTEHPGKPCKEIDGDSISLRNDSCNLSSERNVNSKVEKRKILRRLART